MEKLDETGVYRLDDGRLRVRATATDPDTGKIAEKQRTLQTGATIEDAVATRNRLKAEIRRTTTERAPTTIADYAEQWMKRRAAKVTDSTLGKYRRALSYHVLPRLGHLELDKVTRRDVAGWVRWAEEATMDDGESYATSTVKTWWRTLRMLLKDAHAEGYLERDPTSRLAAPETGVEDKREKATLKPAELWRLVDHAPEVAPRRSAEIVTLALTGMRPGELYGLEWDDLDFAGEGVGLIHIRRSVYRGDVRPTTKTGADRVVPALPRVQCACEEHRQRLMRNQHAGLDDGIVFPSQAGTRRNGHSLYDALDDVAAVAEIGPQVRPQVLRRSLNTALQSAGVPRHLIREMLGHTSDRMTERYTRFDADRKKDAIARLSDL